VVSRVRLPVVGGLVKVLSQPASSVAAVVELQGAVNTLNQAVAGLQSPSGAAPGTFSQSPSARIHVWPISGNTNAFLDAGSAPAADPSILVHRGRRGEDGEDGRRGYQGVAGARGLSGLNAPRGRPGDDGEFGRQGYPGVPGVAGATGGAGPAGPAGATGLGVRGRTGDDGDEGKRGFPGSAGAAGPTGAQGPPAIRGRTGDDGDEGKRGFPGSAGAAGAGGATGGTGPTGLTGSPGPRGKEGVDGDEGRRGAPGLAGSAGAPGSAGAAGPRGLQGFDGDDGHRTLGAVGSVGPLGATGSPGPRGKEGVDGDEGRRGAPGLTGSAGAAGQNGLAIRGQRGDDGDDNTRHRRVTLRGTAATKLVGLTATSGISDQFMPIDAVLALDTSIAPTWTGAHIFNGGECTFNNGITMNASVAGTPTCNGISGAYSFLLLGVQYGGIAFGSTLPWVASNSSTTSSGNNYTLINFSTDPTQTTRGSIYYNATSGLVVYGTTSDERLKRNIRDSVEAGTILDAIKVRAFEWDEKHAPGAKMSHWFVAQELAEAYPAAALHRMDVRPKADAVDMWHVDATSLIPLLVKEVQALRARLAKLEH